MLTKSSKTEVYIYEAPAPRSPETTRRWLELAGALVLVGLGLGLRLYNLATQPLWYDESFNLALVQHMICCIDDTGRWVLEIMYDVTRRKRCR